MTTATTESTQKGSSAPVSGGSLYYEALGRGPTLVMIRAGRGTGVVFEPLAASLASHFRVIIYDRRYFFHSCKCDPIGSAQNQRILKTHAEDAAALIAHVSLNCPLYLTTSSGEMIAGELLYSRPHLIRRLVMHEASFFSLLPTLMQTQWRKNLVGVWSKKRQHGEIKLNSLIVHWFHRSEELELLKKTPTFRRILSLPREMKFKWLANEFPEILEYEFQVDKMRPFLDRLLLMRGSVISPHAAVGPATRLSDALGLPLCCSRRT